MLVPYTPLGHTKSHTHGIRLALSSMIQSLVIQYAACLCPLMQKTLSWTFQEATFMHRISVGIPKNQRCKPPPLELATQKYRINTVPAKVQN